MLTNFFHKLISKTNSPMHFIDASQSKIKTSSSLIDPSMGFTLSLHPVFNYDTDSVRFSNYKIGFIFEGSSREMAKLVKNAQNLMARYIKANEEHFKLVGFFNEMHLADSLLVWPIPKENKFFCMISSFESNSLIGWSEHLQKNKQIIFECGDMSIPRNFSGEEKIIFEEKNKIDNRIGEDKVELVWNWMMGLERARHFALQEKSMLYSNIELSAESRAINKI